MPSKDHRQRSRVLLTLALCLLSCSRGGVPPEPVKTARSTQALTPTPVTRVKKINTVPDVSTDSEPSNFVQIGSTAYFSAKSPGVGQELWKTDGTPAGTVFLKDLNPGPDSSWPQGFTELNGKVYFYAENEFPTQRSLWRTDGTPAGTEQLPLVYQDAISGRVAIDAISSIEKSSGYLFIDGGNEQGSAILVRLNPATLQITQVLTQESLSGMSVYSLLDVNGTLYCNTSNTLRTVSPGSNLAKLVSFPPYTDGVSNLTNINGVLYFSFRTNANGVELWRTDGSAPGTYLVKDLIPGVESGDPRSFRVANNTLFFAAQTAGGWNEHWLWKSDGTETGTVIVKMIQPYGMISTGQRIFFQAYDATGLWTSDGTEAGTVRVTNASIENLTNVNGTAYFRVGNALWKSDGTPAGTVAVKTTGLGVGNIVTTMTSLFGKAFFTASDNIHGTDLWVSDGTEAGTVFFKDIYPVKSSSSPTDFVDVNGTLFFVADDGVHGRELWKSDGTEAGTMLVRDIEPGVFSPYIASPVNLNGTLYFFAGSDLWKSDGTAGGTTLVARVDHSGSSKLVVLNGSLYFSAYESSYGTELWKSDGTAAGTVRMADVMPGYGSSDPADLMKVGSTLFFTAIGPGVGRELWKSDGTAAGTVLVKDIVAGSDGSYLTHLRGVRNQLFFYSRDPLTGMYNPWQSNGTAAGTFATPLTSGGKLLFPFHYNPVTNLAFLMGMSNGVWNEIWNWPATGSYTVVGGVTLDYLVAVDLDNMTGGDANGVLVFPATDGSGNEPWRTNGTLPGVTRLKDIAPGSRDSKPKNFFSIGGVVLFTANDWEHGRELWRTAGTEASTTLVQDIFPGSSNSDPQSFIRVGDKIFFTALDTDDGRELFVMPLSTVDAPPQITCPGTVRAERGPSGFATATFLATATDDGVMAPPTYSRASGSQFPLGSTTVTASVTDQAGSTATCQFTVEVEEGAPPTITCPSDTNLEATNPSGAPAKWAAAVATDTVTATPAVTYSKSLGSSLAFGTTAITATATDAAGNTASCTFNVTVRDTKPPTLSCPSNVTLEATSAAGVVPNFQSVTATDLVTTTPTVTYSPSAASDLPLGTTTVTVTATDTAGNSASCAFNVTVLDTRAPVITCPQNVTVDLQSGTGMAVNFAPATATDEVTTAPVMTYSKSPGSYFPLGLTTVTVTATDIATHSASCTFTVLVRDATPPDISCPPNAIVEATGTAGATVNFSPAVATDAISGAATVSYSKGQGTVFALGTTTVTASASDAAGNHATCDFTVTVRDSTPPVITCPADLEVEATSTLGATVPFSATASDSVTASPPIAYSKNPGQTFTLGETTVIAVATDAAGNTKQCSFKVTVSDTTAPQLKCPQSLTVEATSENGAMVTWPEPVATDAVSTPVVMTSHPAVSPLPLGENTITVTARDTAGNEAQCSFTVTVQDTTPPTIEKVADVKLEATSPAGAVLQSPELVVTDAVTPLPTVTLTPESGAVLPLGRTTVTIRAIDAAGNERTDTFVVNVVDTIAPQVQCPAAIEVVTTGDKPVSVEFPPVTATDAVTPNPEVTANFPSRSFFLPGTNTVTFTAEDGAGNTGTCQLVIKVVPSTPTPVKESGCSQSGASALGLAMFLAFLRRGRSRAGSVRDRAGAAGVA